MTPTVTTAIRIDEGLVTKLKETADKLGVTTDALIRVIIEDYLRDKDLKYSTSGKGKDGP